MIAVAPALRTALRSMDRRRRVVPLSPTCSGIVAAHDAVDPRRFVMGVNHQPITLCRGCADVMDTLVSLMPDRRR